MSFCPCAFRRGGYGHTGGCTHKEGERNASAVQISISDFLGNSVNFLARIGDREASEYSSGGP